LNKKGFIFTPHFVFELLLGVFCLFFSVSKSSRTLKTNRAGQSAIPPPKASATAVASKISSRLVPMSTALLT